MWIDEIDAWTSGVVLPARGPLGRATRELRHTLHMSQAQLARTVGATQPSVSRLERGAPNWSLFCRIVEAAGGHPVVTVERAYTERELFERLFALDASADDWVSDDKSGLG